MSLTDSSDGSDTELCFHNDTCSHRRQYYPYDVATPCDTDEEEEERRTCFRTRYRSKPEENMKVLTWWQYSANENSLEEWDQDVQYYNEETDKFRMWSSYYGLDLATVSTLRSLRLDDDTLLSKLQRTQNALQALKKMPEVDYPKLEKALKRSHTFEDFTFNDSLPYEDEGRIDEEDVCTEEEFSLRPRLRRDLPLRRSTRPPNRTGVQTKRSTLPSRSRDSRRLSWETFTFFGSKGEKKGGEKSEKKVERGVSREDSITSTSSKRESVKSVRQSYLPHITTRQTSTQSFNSCP